MIDRAETFIHLFRFLFVSLLVVAGLFALSVMLVTIKSPSAGIVNAQTSHVYADSALDGDANVVTSGMGSAANELSQAVAVAGKDLAASTQVVASAVAGGGKVVADSTMNGARVIGGAVAGTASTAARAVGGGVSAAGNAVGSGVVFVLHVPGAVLETVTNTTVVRAVIRPSDDMEVPIIDPDSPELKAALASLPATPASQAPAQTSQGPAWPIHGQITTYFGVPHRPFQRTHTGMDISDGQRSGVTPIKPFRPGRVLETISSRYGLGNHVIVDHGSGVTSVYAHLASIAVSAGQEVGMETVLGTEGSTGASTGTHLHFEIRVNGQATDPRQFISGQP